MPSTATASLRLELQAQGENLDSWGEPRLNTVISLLEEATCGVLPKTITGNVTLTSTNFASDESRHAVLVITANGAASTPTITIPGVEKTYLVHNKSTTRTITLSAGGTTASVVAGDLAYCYCDGTDVYVVATGVSAAAYAALADAETVTGLWTFTGSPRINTTLDFHEDTWGGRVGRIVTTTTGDWFFRPTSAAGVDASTKEFIYNNTQDRWEFEHDLKVGNDLTVTGATTFGGDIKAVEQTIYGYDAAASINANPALNRVLGYALSASDGVGNGRLSIYGSATSVLYVGRVGDGAVQQFYHSAGTGVQGSITLTSTATAYNTSSDARLKANAVPLVGVIDARALLTDPRAEPKRYDRTDAPGVKQDGLIAQELFEIIPQAVTPGETLGDPWMIDYGRLTPYLMAICRYQEQRIDALEAANADLAARVTALEAL